MSLKPFPFIILLNLFKPKTIVNYFGDRVRKQQNFIHRVLQFDDNHDTPSFMTVINLTTQKIDDNQNCNEKKICRCFHALDVHLGTKRSILPKK